MGIIFAAEDFWAQFGQFVQVVFGGDKADPDFAWYQYITRAAVVYIVGLVIVRIGKSRLIGRNTALDIILGFILGSLLSRGITGHASMSGTAIACAGLVAVHWVFTAIGYHSHVFGRLFKGNVDLLVHDGQVNDAKMRHSHISMNDLLEELRIRGLETVDEVKLAYKERNGQISVIKAPKRPHIVDVAVAHGVQTVRIEIS